MSDRGHLKKNTRKSASFGSGIEKQVVVSMYAKQNIQKSKSW